MAFPTTYTIAFFLSLLISLLLVPLIRNLSIKYKWLDDPSRSSRTIHQRLIPRTGGIGILIAFLAPLVGLFFVRSGVGGVFVSDFKMAVSLLIGGVIVAFIGLIDDLYGIRASKKFILQSLVAIFSYMMGFKIQSVSLPFIGVVEMGVFAPLVTLLWIVGIINAINLVDGIDGLAAGLAFFVCVTNFVFGFASNNIIICLISAALGGALLGFLYYNFNPASIFMGDAGSMFIGYILATSSLWTSMKKGTTVALLIPIISLGLPIMDTLVAMFRRFILKRPIFSPDRGHIHHRLLQKGYSQKKTVVILYTISIIFALAAIFSYFGDSLQVGISLLALLVITIGVVRFIGGFSYIKYAFSYSQPLHSRHAELFRFYLPLFLKKIENVSDVNELERIISEFVIKTDIFSFEIFKKSGNEEKPVLIVKNPNYDDIQKRAIVMARFPMMKYDRPYTVEELTVDAQEEVLNSVDMNIRFVWFSERTRISQESAILLQILSDQISNLITSKGWLVD
ncbi:MAG: undecaprenyl/decaprenyl-phosphate alpha-N-acetylglucosaminyl 1-phosphate transferase [Deltaproteobacteria bacterium]|nr:undecaprenyl/decaprenyl-phosphate alpha-N-acetylglucosaminyl 1-phosphate transferase [Deltaproteobacteria bacterium]